MAIKGIDVWLWRVFLLAAARHMRCTLAHKPTFRGYYLANEIEDRKSRGIFRANRNSMNIVCLVYSFKFSVSLRCNAWKRRRRLGHRELDIIFWINPYDHHNWLHEIGHHLRCKLGVSMFRSIVHHSHGSIRFLPWERTFEFGWEWMHLFHYKNR